MKILIENFQRLSNEISLAISSDDENLLSCLDGQIVVAWQQVMDSNPVDLVETQLLLDFLLNQLADQSGLDGSAEQIKRKIQNLFETSLPHQATARPETYTEIAAGFNAR